MKKLLLMIPVVAGCTTAPVAATAPSDSALREEIKVLRQEVNDLKAQDAFRRFRRGERVRKPADKRNDLPKGVQR